MTSFYSLPPTTVHVFLFNSIIVTLWMSNYIYLISITMLQGQVPTPSTPSGSDTSSLLFSSGGSCSSTPPLPTLSATPNSQRPIFRPNPPANIEPVYSPYVQAKLENGEIDECWTKFIEETAYYILGNHPKERNYQDLGRSMCHKYPCVANESGKTEWVSIFGFTVPFAW